MRQPSYRKDWRNRPVRRAAIRVDGTIYADYQAATPTDPRVITAMTEAMQHLFANPHSQDHVLGWRAAQAIDQSAQRIAALVGAEGEEVTFTSGASEANAMAIAMAIHVSLRSERDTLVISEGDHGSLRQAALDSALNIVEIPLDRDGAPDTARCEELVSDRTAMISVVGVNNENGAIADLEAIGKIATDKGAVFHADLAQAPLACTLTMESARLGCVTLSSHKLYGPKGIGAFVVADPLRDLVRPLFRGAGQQDGRRGGTVPTELCVGFGEACRLVLNACHDERERIGAIRDAFVGAIGQNGVGELIGSRGPRHPGNALMRFPGISAADLLGQLQTQVAASTQAACSSGSIEPSHVLLAMGLSREQAGECVRFSFGRFSDEAQALEIAAIVCETIERGATLHSDRPE